MVGFPLTQQKDMEVLSALSAAACLCSEAWPMKGTGCSGPRLHPVSVLLGVSVMEITTLACP